MRKEYKTILVLATVYARIKKLAEDEKRSIGKQIEVLLDNYTKHHEKDN